MNRGRGSLAGRIRAQLTPRRGSELPKRLVGREMSHLRSPKPIPIWALGCGIAGAVFAALAIVHVRVVLIEQGYARAAAVERETELTEKRRLLTAEVRRLRNPARLATLAQEFELSRPERVIALAPPGPELRP